MHISNRTLIEIASASAGVFLIADAYSCLINHRKANEKLKAALMYYADVMDRNEVSITEFDRIAIDTIAES